VWRAVCSGTMKLIGPGRPFQDTRHQLVREKSQTPPKTSTTHLNTQIQSSKAVFPDMGETRGMLRKKCQESIRSFPRMLTDASKNIDGFETRVLTAPLDLTVGIAENRSQCGLSFWCDSAKSERFLTPNRRSK